MYILLFEFLRGYRELACLERRCQVKLWWCSMVGLDMPCNDGSASILRKPGEKCGLVDPQHCGPADGVILERVQNAIGVAQRGYLDLGMDGNLGGEAEEILAVLPSVIGDAAQDTLAVEQIVIEWWNRTHVDAAQREGSALFQGL
jgi:hypothetical protein